MNFTLDQLRALEAIARTGTFAEAAAELHRVPSAVSYLVRGLESALDVPLFDRSGRKATLTKAGVRVLDATRDLLTRAHALQDLAVELSGGWEAELHVVVDGALPMGPLAGCLRRFADPEVPTNLRVDVEYQEGVVDRFEDGPADIGLFLGFAGDGDSDGYDLIPLPELELVMVATPDHRLANARMTDASTATHAELVVRDSSPRYAQRSKPSFMGSRNVVFLSDFHAKRVALLAGAGYGWIPHHLVAGDLDEGRLVLLLAEPNRWTYYPQLGTRKGARLGRAGRLFVETLVGPPEAVSGGGLD